LKENHGDTLGRCKPLKLYLRPALTCVTDELMLAA
jgi:hypothetical protein